MPITNARIPGFHKMPLEDRLHTLAECAQIPIADLTAAIHQGGIDSASADKIIENAVGTYALPFGVALNFLINQADHLVPMAVEEPSVVAAASHAAKMVRQGGGFTASVDPSIMACQIQVYAVPNMVLAQQRVMEAKLVLLDKASRAVEQLVSLGGGPRDLEVRVLADDMLVVHVYTDCKDAMGANMVNTIAEALGPDVAQLTGGTLGLRILSNLCDRRLVRATCEVPADAIAARGMDGMTTIERIVQASRFAELDPYRAVTHNKGIMNGVDPVVIATGNDWRAVEAGAHAYAARTGQYRPLAVWQLENTAQGAVLKGTLEMPLSLGVVGGTLRVHPTARLALRLMGVSTAGELAQVAACAGLASNLAALRALATEGIQRGHMTLHARSVAHSVGAVGDDVERIARIMVAQGNTTVEYARSLLSMQG